MHQEIKPAALNTFLEKWLAWGRGSDWPLIVNILICIASEHSIITQWILNRFGSRSQSGANQGWPGPCCHGLTWHEYLALSVPVCVDRQRFESSSCWWSLSYCTLNTDLKRQIDVFSNKCLHSIMGYPWKDFVSNQRLLHETESRPIFFILLSVVPVGLMEALGGRPLPVSRAV